MVLFLCEELLTIEERFAVVTTATVHTAVTHSVGSKNQIGEWPCYVR